jgi:hypothetical protein
MEGERGDCVGRVFRRQGTPEALVGKALSRLSRCTGGGERLKPQGTKASRRVQALIAQVDVLEFRRCPIR